MSTSKPVEWVSALIERFEDQVHLRSLLLPFSLIVHAVTDQMRRINESNATQPRAEQGMSHWLESIQVLLGHQRTDRYSQNHRQHSEIPPPRRMLLSDKHACLSQRFGGYDQEKNIYESYLIVLDAVEQCLANVSLSLIDCPLQLMSASFRRKI